MIISRMKARQEEFVRFFVIFIANLLSLSLLLELSHINTEALVVQTNPFWMPLDFDIGTGYFKTNVFVQGFKADTGLTKVCVTADATNHTLCHYMNVAEEEGQIISPYVSVHAGIFVFPSSQVPINSSINVCITILQNEKILCESIINDPKTIEQMVDLCLISEHFLVTNLCSEHE